MATLDLETLVIFDASRAVGVASALLSEEKREGFLREVLQTQETLRERHEAGIDRPIEPLAEARSRSFIADPATSGVVRPAQLGIQVLDGPPLGDLVDRIDWTPFFHTWELRGAYPRILDDPLLGEQARQLLADARTMLENWVKDAEPMARGVFGLFPANRIGDDIEVYVDEERSAVRSVLRTLRQQTSRSSSGPSLALADYLMERDTGSVDYIGAFAVSAGFGLDGVVAGHEADHDDYASILAKALADRLAAVDAEGSLERFDFFDPRESGFNLSDRWLTACSAPPWPTSRTPISAAARSATRSHA